MSAAARRVPIRTRALLGHPPPAVAVIALLSIAQRTLTTSLPPGAGRQSRALSAGAPPVRGLAPGARLVALGGLAVSPVCPAPMRGGAAHLPSAFSPLLPLFVGLPGAAALLAAARRRGGRGAADALRVGDHQLRAFVLTWVLGRGARRSGLLFALHGSALLAVFAALFLESLLAVPRVSNFAGVLGLLPGLSVHPVPVSDSFSANVLPVVVR